MPAYRYDPFVNERADTIAKILEQQGQIRARQALTVGEAQARAAEQSGQAWGSAIGQIGQSIAAIPQQIQQQRQQAVQQQAARQQLEVGAMQLAAAKQRAADLTKLDELFAQPGGLDDVLARTPGHLRDEVMKDYEQANKLRVETRQATEAARKTQMEYLGSLASRIRANKYDPSYALGALHHARETFADDPQMVKQIDQWRLQTIQQPDSMRDVVDFAIANSSFRDELKPKAPVSVAPGASLVDPTTGKPVFTAPDPRQAETTRHNEAMESIGRMTAGRGEAAQVETARHNRAMEEAARNTKTSRPVLSGDANRIADIDTSIDDAQLLQQRLKGEGAPGVFSRIGASMPNVVSEVTGWGADAKSRQAVIDLAKQIIGKGLEGGVLRKEDEAKYARILPTIGDAPDVAQAKFESLISVLGQKRARTIEALSDAGFNVSKYDRTERQGEPSPPPPIKPVSSHGAGNPRLPKFD